MYPGCRFMDFHPRETDQMSYAPHHAPAFRHVPPQMKMDTARSPVNYESFPCYGSYVCPYPLPYQACYHNQVPDHHSYGLGYPHYAPPPPVYCHGSYPPLPGSYPFHYLPSPHYSVADPRYEYDKKGPVDHHCCGCPNHQCQQKENKNLKIQTSDDEKDRDASLIPSELKDQSYPVLWIPPGYKRNEEGEQTIKPESKRESSLDKEAKGSLKPCAQEPGVWSGWLPIDLNNLKSLVQGRDEKGTEHQQNKDGKSSFPVGCMPRNPEQMGKLELEDGDQKSFWEPSQYGIFPLKFIENQDKKSKPEVDTENSENSSSEDGPKMGAKNVVKKIIPVKQMDRSEEKGLLNDGQNEENRAPKVEKNHSEMPLKHTDKKSEKKHLENNSNVQSSLSKASKLPPVCLRVDPLPSRRTKSGSTRSPSPPANKKKSEMLSHDDKTSSSSTMEANIQQNMQSSADSDLGRFMNEKKLKNIEVVDSTVRDNKINSCKEDLSESPIDASNADSEEKVSSGCHDGKGGNSDQEFSGDKGVKNVNKLSGEVTTDEKLTFEGQSSEVKGETGANGGPIDTKESEQENTNAASYKKFSEAEAAAIIQSAYRGFGVRRWEPLKKLKEISRIKGELIKVRLDVQNLVSSGSGNIDKQRILIGETIMNLLLKLDTMQGLHPSIRNIRKSVAKELVSLQEKLDSITFQNSDELNEFDESKHAEEISKKDGEEEREKVGEDKHEQDTTSPSHVKSDTIELCQDKPHTAMDTDISSVNMGKSELLLSTDELGRASEEKEPDSSEYVDLKERLEPIEVREPSEVHDVCEDHDSFLVELKELPPPPPLIAAEEELNPVVQLQVPFSLADSDWSSREDEGTEVNTEVPPRVPEQNSDAQVFGEGLQIDGGRCIVKPGEPEDHDSVLVESKELPPSVAAEEKPNHVVELQNLSPLVDSDWSIKEDEVTKVNTEVPPRVPGKLELVQESGLISLDNEAKETSAEEQQPKTLLTESPNLSAPEDNIATTVFSEGASEPKDNISAVRDLDRDKEFGGDDMLGVKFMEAIALKEEHASNRKAEANVYVEGDDKSIDNMPTAAVGVDTTEISDLKVANARQFKGEGDDKPMDDMQAADNVGAEAKEILDIKAAVNVCQVGGDDKPIDDMQTADTVGIEQRDTPEVNEFERDVRPDENLEFIEICGTELEDQSMATSDLQVKQQKPSFVKDTVSGEEVHMEKTANCNIEQKMAVDEDQEMWEDKFDNKEIYQKHSDGYIYDLHRDEDLVEEELGTKKVKKEPPRECSTGEEDMAGEELVGEQLQKEVPASLPILGQISSVTETESDKKLAEENEKLKETVEKLIAAGKSQLTAISNLSERVKDLEKKLSRRKKLKMRRHKYPSQYLLQV